MRRQGSHQKSLSDTSALQQFDLSGSRPPDVPSLAERQGIPGLLQPLPAPPIPAGVGLANDLDDLFSGTGARVGRACNTCAILAFPP